MWNQYKRLSCEVSNVAKKVAKYEKVKDAEKRLVMHDDVSDRR